MVLLQHRQRTARSGRHGAPIRAYLHRTTWGDDLSGSGGMATPDRAAGRGGVPRAAVHVDHQVNSTEPPAASILSLAEAEAASTVMVTATLISPLPRTLTGCPPRTAPLATRSSIVT